MTVRRMLMMMMGVVLAAPLARGDDLATLLKIMPGDQTVAIALANPEALEESMQSVAKRLDGGGDAGFLDELKDELRFGKAIDYTRPLGIIITGQPPMWDAQIFVVEVPTAEAEVKAVDGATLEGGIWTLPDSGMVLKIVGKHVMISESIDALRSISESTTRLAETVQAHAAAVRGRDAVIRLDLDKMRPILKQGLAQGKQMAPMMAMMMASGGDPSGTTTALNAVLAAAGSFVDQVNSLVLGVSLSRDNLNVALSTGFGDGGISKYLAVQQPPRRTFFTALHDQPFMWAMSYDMPGAGPPFFDYLAEQMKPMAEATEGTDTGALAEATQKALAFYRLIDGSEGLSAFSDNGMQACNYYWTGEPAEFVETMQEAMLAGDQLMNMAAGGMTFELGESRRYGNVDTVELEMKMDPANPQAMMMAQMMGDASRMSIGVLRDRVGQVAGPEAYREAFFSGKVDKPLASNPFAKAAIEALQGRPNIVVLVDPAGLMPLFGAIAPMMGGPANLPKLTPGPAVSVGVTLSANPARLDVNVPWAAIERIMKALEADAPM